MTTSFRSKADAAVAPQLATTDCMLKIVNGLQAGACLSLCTGVHRIGGSLANDVVVFEAALAEDHFEVEHGDTTWLRACSASLHLSDGMDLPAGRSMPVTGTLQFQVGCTKFCLVAAVPRKIRTTRRLAVPVAALAACVAVVLGMSAHGTESSAALGRLPREAARSIVFAPAATEVAAVLGNHLVAAGLSGLQPVAGADGTVTVSGNVSPEQKAGWTEIMRWFDSNYGGRVMLIDQVGTAVAVAPLSIAAVRPGGDAPFVIDQSGRRLFVGSAVADGWVVAAIEPTRVTVRRHAETLTVRF